MNSDHKNLGDKLIPCPFCKRKMIFHKDTYTNKHGKSVTEQYYMHDESDSDEECILDQLMMPLVIGAGDADEESGRIGEYAETWNRQLSNR